MLNLPNRAFHAKLMSDGEPSRPFAGRALPPGARPLRDLRRRAEGE